jgi:hypothetical protein
MISHYVQDSAGKLYHDLAPGAVADGRATAYIGKFGHAARIDILGVFRS